MAQLIDSLGSTWQEWAGTNSWRALFSLIACLQHCLVLLEFFSVWAGAKVCILLATTLGMLAAKYRESHQIDLHVQRQSQTCGQKFGAHLQKCWQMAVSDGVAWLTDYAQKSLRALSISISIRYRPTAYCAPQPSVSALTLCICICLSVCLCMFHVAVWTK